MKDHNELCETQYLERSAYLKTWITDRNSLYGFFLAKYFWFWDLVWVLLFVSNLVFMLSTLMRDVFNHKEAFLMKMQSL